MSDDVADKLEALLTPTAVPAIVPGLVVAGEVTSAT